MPIVIACALLLHSTLWLVQAQPACAEASACRAAALEAARQKDYEAFHDLSWRAVQKGRPNDPELMLMLARAQSVSGRPGDALVMLRRIAETGIAIDVAADEDFRRVRALPGWPAVETLIAAARDKAAGASAPPVPAGSAAELPAAKPDAARTAKPTATGTTPKAGAETPAMPMTAPAPARNARAEPGGSAEALRLTSTAIDAIGLAYDSASRRFVVGDRRANKVIVADEVFKRVNDFIGAGSGGFGTLSALEIDRRRGDLWITSADQSGAASLHKLQLVSGRVLSKIDLPADLAPIALADISVSDDGTLRVVDRAGARLFQLSASGRTLDRPMQLGLSSPVSVAAVGAATYVAHAGGLAVADSRSATVTVVAPANGIKLDGLRRIRWHRGSIVAIQDGPDGSGARLVRIHLSGAGRKAAKLEVLDSHAPEEGSALTISNNDAFYVAHTADGPVIRRVPLEP